MKYVVRFNEVGHKYPKFECRHVEANSKEEAIKKAEEKRKHNEYTEVYYCMTEDTWAIYAINCFDRDDYNARYRYDRKMKKAMGTK